MVGKHGLYWIIGAAALWGTTGTAQALGPETSNPLAVGMMRLVVAAPALMAMALAGGRLPPSSSQARAPTLLAAVAMAAYQPAFFTAVDATGVAVGTVVAIGSAPVLAGLIGWIVDREAPSRNWWPATGLGIAGIALIALESAAAAVDPGGIAFALAAGLSFAVYITASKRVVGLSDPIAGMAVVFSLAAALSLPLLLWVDLSWLRSGTGVLMVLHLGLVATAAAYVMFAIGLHSTPSAAAATASLAEPATAALLGVVVLHETPGVPAWAGMALLLAGLGVLAMNGADVRRHRTILPTKGWD